MQGRVLRALAACGLLLDFSPTSGQLLACQSSTAKDEVFAVRIRLPKPEIPALQASPISTAPTEGTAKPDVGCRPKAFECTWRNVCVREGDRCYSCPDGHIYDSGTCYKCPEGTSLTQEGNGYYACK
jgi:hypothetical protein